MVRLMQLPRDIGVVDERDFPPARFPDLPRCTAVFRRYWRRLTGRRVR